MVADKTIAKREKGKRFKKQETGSKQDIVDFRFHADSRIKNIIWYGRYRIKLSRGKI